MHIIKVTYPQVDSAFVEQAYREALEVFSPMQEEEKLQIIAEIKERLQKRNAVLIAHYYTAEDIQELAESTGGCVADSLEMARFGRDHAAQTLIVAGVRFMGETAKILSPKKRVLMPSLRAECSLDLNCPAELFRETRNKYPDRTAVVYANTSAAVKAEADWVVTSSNALKIVSHLKQEGRKILWAPDRFLGDYIQRETGADMFLWPGSCIVHEKFKASALVRLKERYPQAEVLVHPESPMDIINLADYVGSTTNLLNAARKSQASVFIVATEPGIFYKMRQAMPEKLFLEAPKEGEGATCVSCSRCPWMAMNGLRNLLAALRDDNNEIHVEEDIRIRAVNSINRMMSFSFANPSQSACLVS
ncbi:quinolinate synthase NadA [Candidatus Electronema sp. PJ]|uniref:quinolinate synthase NadA n=1 Tax=Candidatus Electronema sp. PJ TaxID=3401572 RepID=UPI003AA8A58A